MKSFCGLSLKTKKTQENDKEKYLKELEKKGAYKLWLSKIK